MCWADYKPSLRETEELVALTDAVRRLSGSLEIDELARRGALEVRRATGRAFGAVAVIDLDGERSIAYEGELHEDRATTVEVLEDLVSRAIAERRPLLVDLCDVRVEPHRCRCCGLLAVPAIDHEDLAAIVVVGDSHSHLSDKLSAWVVEYARSLAPLVLAALDADRRVGRGARSARYRLATELHDTLGQLLYAMTVTAHQARGGDPASLKSGMDSLASQASQAAGCLRQAIDTFAAVNDEVGFPALVQDEACAFTERTGISCTVVNLASSEADTLLADACMLRALREGLHNVEKHTHATSVVITLEASDHRLELIIQDDGGHEVDEPWHYPASVGFGLRSLRRDFGQIGGHVSLDRNEDAGMTLRVSVPSHT